MPLHGKGCEFESRRFHHEALHYDAILKLAALLPPFRENGSIHSRCC